MAFWPIDLRERFGRLCNRLEEEGIPFPLSEWQAFQVFVKFLQDYERSHPSKPISYVLPYHRRGIDSYGKEVWIPRKMLQDVNFDNSFELDREGLAFLVRLNESLVKLSVGKRKKATNKIYRKTEDPKKQSPDFMKIITKSRRTGRKRRKHSDKNKMMF